MVLARYLIKRYVAYFCVLTFFLAIVFNLIEFFEKLMRASQASLSKIGYFVLLNCTASFIDLMPLGAWLATVLVIRDLIIREEWEILTLLGVRRFEILKIIMTAACVVVVMSLLLDELFLRDLASKADSYRQITFKGRRVDRVFDGWYQLDGAVFCRVGMLDFEKNVGSKLSFFYLSPTFSIKKIVQAEDFLFKDQLRNLTIIKGNTLDFYAEEIKESVLNDSVLDVPVLLETISDSRQVFSLCSFLKRYVLSQAFSSFLRPELWGLFLERIFFYIQLVFLSVVTSLMFFIFEEKSYGRWVSMFLVYPLHMIMGAFFRGIFDLGWGMLFFGVAYLFLSVMLMAILYRLKHDFL